MGANAVISADFEANDILHSIAMLFSAYGTAIVAKSANDVPSS